MRANLKRQMLLAALLAAAGGCGRRSGGASAAASASASVQVARPTVVLCYEGCLDLNKGRTDEQAELPRNCAHKCSRICAKGCAAERTSDRLGDEYKSALAACSVECNKVLTAAGASPP